MGLSKAVGDYIIFLDSDDIYKKNLINELYSRAKETDADVVICKFDRLNSVTGECSKNNGIAKNIKINNVISPKNMDIFTITNPAPWNKIFKRNFIIENELTFSSTKISNDVFFVLMSLVCAKKIAFVDKSLIIHRYINVTSITSRRG